MLWRTTEHYKWEGVLRKSSPWPVVHSAQFECNLGCERIVAELVNNDASELFTTTWVGSAEQVGYT